MAGGRAIQGPRFEPLNLRILESWKGTVLCMRRVGRGGESCTMEGRSTAEDDG